MKSHKWLFVIAIVIGAAAGLGLYTYVNRDQPLVTALVYPPPQKPLAEISLLKHDGSEFTLDDFRGQWSFVFFGYTFCPDICPTTLSTFAKVAEQLPKSLQQDTQFVFVSVDPERDTPERLNQYVPYFNPEFIGATGSLDGIRGLTSQLGATFIKSPGNEADPESYLVDHTSRIFLVSPEGQRWAIFDFHAHPHKAVEAAAVVSDYEKIRNKEKK